MLLEIETETTEVRAVQYNSSEFERYKEQCLSGKKTYKGTLVDMFVEDYTMTAMRLTLIYRR